MMMFLLDMNLSYMAEVNNDADSVLSIHSHCHLTLYMDKMVDAMREMIVRLEH
jgi:hypothetical protein